MADHRCPECSHPLKDLGYWNGSEGRRIPLYRCINRHCGQCAVSHARIDTTFASRSWI